MQDSVIALPVRGPRAAVRSAAVATDIHAVSAETLSDLAPHLEGWTRLAEQAPQGVPCLLPAWTEAYFRTRLAPGVRWLCCFAYSGERLVGVLPVIAHPHPLLGQAWPVLKTPADDLTPSGDILLAPDHADTALLAMLAEVSRRIPRHLGIDFAAVRACSPLWGAVAAADASYVRSPGTISRFSFLRVRGDLEEYLAGLGNMRRNLKRFRKKLEQVGPVSLIWTKGAEAGDRLADFIALEEAGWKGRNGTAMASNSGAIAFFSEVTNFLSPVEGVEWYSLHVGGQLVATQLCIRCGTTLMLAKIAFDEKFSDCRPGHVLTGEVIRAAFARDDILELNHLSNADADGAWRMSYDPYSDIHLVRRGFMSTLFQLPRTAFASFYQSRVRPRIPPGLKAAYRAYRRRGDRKPLRSAESRKARSE